MPKVSDRQQVLGELETIMKYSKVLEILNEEEFSSDLSSESFDDENLTFLIAGTLQQQVSQNRYLQRTKLQSRSREYVLDYFLHQSAFDFRTITRVTHEVFHHILALIENDPIFHNQSRIQQFPVHWQLACALDRLGNDGQGVSHARSKFIWGIGQGIVHLYTRRVVAALCNLKGQYIRWPDAEGREQISRRLARKGFKGCVGFVNGMCIPLHKKPAVDGNVFMDRKKCYSVNAQIVCDDQFKITFFQSGYPGSSGDSRVFSQSSLVVRARHAFSANEYLLSDCAYAASRTLVPAYKDNQHDNRNDRHERAKIDRFNTYLAKARIVNEHTIGILKARWTSLKGMCVDYHKNEDMRTVVEQLTACIVLHNICLNRDPWDEEFREAEQDGGHNEVIDGAIQRAALTAGQKKRWAVRFACLRFHDQA